MCGGGVGKVALQLALIGGIINGRRLVGLLPSSGSCRRGRLVTMNELCLPSVVD